MPYERAATTLGIVVVDEEDVAGIQVVGLEQEVEDVPVGLDHAAPAPRR